MQVALRLARRGYGRTSPNPMVGAVLVKSEKAIGQGWHKRAGNPHAEVEALRDAQARGKSASGATLYVTLEPCSTSGRTPPCTDAILAAGVGRVVVGTIDPNPRHRGRGITLLREAGIDVATGCREEQARRLNEAWNHWIWRRRPFVVVKAAMTLDGKIATSTGESKYISGPKALAWAMRLRRGADAVLVGINTVLTDNPSLTPRRVDGGLIPPCRVLPKRIVLDARARTPLAARLVTDQHRGLTTVVVSREAPVSRVSALRKRVNVLVAPASAGRIDLRWLLDRLGQEGVVSLLVEGGGEVNADFIERGLANRVAFVYAPKVIGGRDAPRAVAGVGVRTRAGILRLTGLEWRRVGGDLLLEARVCGR